MSTSAALRLRSGLATDVGKVRTHNEDRAAARAALGLAILADGMGGHHAGDVAATLAIATLEADIERAVRGGAARPMALDDGGRPHAPSMGSDPEASATGGASTKARPTGLSAWFESFLARRRGAAEWLAKGVIQANRKVFGAGDRRDAFSMGTTLVALWGTDEGLLWANVGDSRLYAWREGVLSQVSRDHSLVADYVAAGLLTPEQARDFPHRNIIVRGIGLRATVKVDQGRLEARAGDRYLLCSDGLTDLVADDMIAPHLASGDDPQVAAEALVALALAAGGTDNVTALVIHVHAEAP
jgi:protein phosphatase